MPKSSTNKAKSGPRKGRLRGDSTNGRFLAAIDAADAREFYRANTAFISEVSESKSKAVEALKSSGYLTASGKLSKRYR